MENIIENKKILLDLANDGHSYWKLSQSQKGRSVESVYAEYIPNRITVAEDNEKKLSFVNEKNILKCYMYGDLLTKFCFDKNNAKFLEICNERYEVLSGGLGEYQSSKLLTEKIYSLQKIDTIVMLLGFSNSPLDVVWLFNGHGYHNLEERLREFGYFETAGFMEYLRKKYNANSLKGAVFVIDKLNEIENQYLRKNF